MDEIVLDLQILEQELGGVLAIGHDTAYFGRRVHDEFRPFLRIKLRYGRGIEQVEFGTGTADQRGKTAPLQLPPDRAACQAAVAGHINPSV